VISVRITLFLLIVTLTFFVPACKPNQRIINSSAEKEKELAPAERPLKPEPAGIEADVAAMRTADFNFIYVFRRKDGGALDSDDRSFMNANTPYEINRKKLADGGRALIVGSNFRFPAQNFKVMKERFAFEDFSKPESEIMSANANSNTP
jgi:hypothetical protein